MRFVALTVILILLSFSEATGQSDSIKKIETWCVEHANQIKQSFPYMSELEIYFFLNESYGSLKFDEMGKLNSARYANCDLRFRNGRIHSITIPINTNSDSINYFINGLEVRFLATDTIVKPKNKTDDCWFLNSWEYRLAELPLTIYNQGKLVAISNDGHSFKNISGQSFDDFYTIQILNALQENEDFELYYQDFETITHQK